MDFKWNLWQFCPRLRFLLSDFVLYLNHFIALVVFVEQCSFESNKTSCACYLFILYYIVVLIIDSFTFFNMLKGKVFSNTLSLFISQIFAKTKMKTMLQCFNVKYFKDFFSANVKVFLHYLVIELYFFCIYLRIEC